MGSPNRKGIHDRMVEAVLSKLRPFPWEEKPAAHENEARPLNLARTGRAGESDRAEQRQGTVSIPASCRDWAERTGASAEWSQSGNEVLTSAGEMPGRGLEPPCPCEH